MLDDVIFGTVCRILTRATPTLILVPVLACAITVKISVRLYFVARPAFLHAIILTSRCLKCKIRALDYGIAYLHS